MYVLAVVADEMRDAPSVGTVVLAWADKIPISTIALGDCASVDVRDTVRALAKGRSIAVSEADGMCAAKVIVAFPRTPESWSQVLAARKRQWWTEVNIFTRLME